jgi:plastocyanin
MAAPHDGRVMRAFILAAGACAALLAAGCGSGDEGGGATTATGTSDTGPTAAAAMSTKIRIKDFEFDPTPATVKAGQRISVANDDDAPHTLTEEPAGGKALFDTGTLKGRAAGSFAVKAPGSYKIYCAIHPFMKGEIKVVS